VQKKLYLLSEKVKLKDNLTGTDETLGFQQARGQELLRATA